MNQAPPGMREAAARSRLRREPLGEGAARVGAAIVTRRGDALVCDCPMADAPFCLHRLLVEASAEPREAKEGLEVGAPNQRSVWIPEGERLPAEDVTRLGPILDEVSALVAEIVTIGLRRAGRVTLERLRQTRRAAAAVRPRSGAPREAGLGRITRSLERLASLLPSLEGPDAAHAAPLCLAELAALRNMTRALRANTGHLPLADLAGAARSEYVEVASLETQGLGLEAWVGPSGTLGLSAYLAVLGTNRVLARTVLTKGASGQSAIAFAARAAASPAFAHGSVTMRDLSRGRFTLSGARVAPSAGRLSGSSATSAAERPALPYDDELLSAFVLSNDKDATRIGRSLVFDPLGRPKPARAVVLVPVSRLSPSDFDATGQRLSLRIRAASGASLATSLPFREDRALYFDNLEVLSRAARPPAWIAARIGRDGGELVVEPITAILPVLGPIDLTIDRLSPELEVE